MFNEKRRIENVKSAVNKTHACSNRNSYLSLSLNFSVVRRANKRKLKKNPLGILPHTMNPFRFPTVHSSAPPTMIAVGNQKQQLRATVFCLRASKKWSHGLFFFFCIFFVGWLPPTCGAFAFIGLGFWDALPDTRPPLSWQFPTFFVLSGFSYFALPFLPAIDKKGKGCIVQTAVRLAPVLWYLRVCVCVRERKRDSIPVCRAEFFVTPPASPNFTFFLVC